MRPVKRSDPVAALGRPPLVLLALLLLSSGLLRPDAVAAQDLPIPDDRPTRVLVIGDSVLLGAANTIPTACTNCEVVVDAAESRSTLVSVQQAGGHDGAFDVVVALLGHNDAGNASVAQAGFEELFDRYALVPRIVVLTLHEVRPGYAELNGFLRDAAETRPNVTVADWHAEVEEHPDATVSDGLHLTAAGSDLLAGVIAAEIDEARKPKEPDEEPEGWTWEPGPDDPEADPDGGTDTSHEEELDSFWDQDPPAEEQTVPEAGGPGSRAVLVGVIATVGAVLIGGAVFEIIRRRRRDDDT